MVRASGEQTMEQTKYQRTWNTNHSFLTLGNKPFYWTLPFEGIHARGIEILHADVS